MVVKTPVKWVPEGDEIIYVNHGPHIGKEMPGVLPLHPWGGGHGKVLDAALEKLDAICGICNC
jgi:hypothetical protein